MRQKLTGSNFALKIIAVVIAAAITIAVRRGWLPASVLENGRRPESSAPSAPRSDGALSSAPTVRELFEARKSDVWIEAAGRVEKLLPDDKDTSDNSDEHQRFVLRTGGITVLVAHNISAAPRVPLKPGDSLTVRGEYEYTPQGGTIHFTHKPKYKTSRTDGGWIEFQGKRFD
ncbi:MAG: DUF3465 domain-containing protein [Planctomycetes bacterium]|nr:DUF3465 domain-containing protein [Planctomycetota bacterium]